MEALTDDAVRPGRNATISNFGIIRSFGANTSGGANGTADGIDAGGNIGVVVTNQTGGLISGARHGITADTDITVVNQAGGTIIGRNGSGIGSDGNGTVTNYGTITGAYAGVGNIFNSDGVAKFNGDGDGVDIDNCRDDRQLRPHRRHRRRRFRQWRPRQQQRRPCARRRHGPEFRHHHRRRAASW